MLMQWGFNRFTLNQFFIRCFNTLVDFLNPWVLCPTKLKVTENKSTSVYYGKASAKAIYGHLELKSACNFVLVPPIVLFRTTNSYSRTAPRRFSDLALSCPWQHWKCLILSQDTWRKSTRLKTEWNYLPDSDKGELSPKQFGEPKIQFSEFGWDWLNYSLPLNNIL